VLSEGELFAREQFWVPGCRLDRDLNRYDTYFLPLLCSPGLASLVTEVFYGHNKFFILSQHRPDLRPRQISPPSPHPDIFTSTIDTVVAYMYQLYLASRVHMFDLKLLYPPS
jgi:hypothetical protein